MSFIGKSAVLGLAASACLTFSAAAMADSVSVPVAGQKPAAVDHGQNCFFLSQWESWHAPSPDVIYMRVRLKDVYRIDLSHGTEMLQDPFAHLINRVEGPDSVCAPIDLNLSVSDSDGMREPLFVKAITKLTPDQIAAIPAKDRP